MSFNISYLRTRYLDIYLTLIHPSRCVERFELTEDKDVVINMKQVGESGNFKQDEYCVEFEQERTAERAIDYPYNLKHNSALTCT